MSCACSSSPATPPDDDPQVPSVSGGTCGAGVSLADYNLYVEGVTTGCAPCGPTANAACSDPTQINNNTSTGTNLDTTWTNAVSADSMTLLGRFGRKLSKLRGTGWLWAENGVAFVRSSLTLAISKLHMGWVRPTSLSLPVPGDPPAFPFLTMADSAGEVKGLPGKRDADSTLVWNKTTRLWEVRSTSHFPLCKEGVLEDSNELELVGFVKQDPDDADYATQIRCLKKLCGVGLVVLEEQLAPGDCSDCSGPADCATTTAHTIDFPPEDGYPYGFTYTLADGLVWRRVGSGTNGRDGANGADGRDGIDGRDGLPGPPGSITNLNYEQLAAVIDYTRLPAGPAGRDGIDGISIQGPPGPTGRDGTNGTDGVDGVDGINGTNTTGGESITATPTADDLAKLSILCQRQEFLGTPVLINSATRDTTVASQTNVYSYLVSNGGTIDDPDDSVEGDLSSVDGVLLRLDVLSSDPQDVDAGASASHSIDVTVNGRQLVYLIQEDAAANAADAGNLLPRVAQLSTSSHCVAPYATTLGVVRTSTKYATTPASSQITKYNAGLNTVRVYVMGFLVTRKVNPVYDPTASA